MRRQPRRPESTAGASASRRKWPIAASSAFIFLLALRADAFQQEPAVDVDPASGVSIRLGLPLSEALSSGFFPVHLQIGNATDSPHAWDLEFGDSDRSPNFRYRTRVVVGSRQAREFDLLVPMAELEPGLPSYRSVQAKISGYGVRNDRVGFGNRYSPGIPTSPVAIAEPLGSTVWGALETKLKEPTHALPVALPAPLGTVRFAGRNRDTSRGLRGSVFRLDEMPADARAFSGLAALWIGEGEWRGLSGVRADAILQWVREGGRLHIAGDGVARLPGLPPAGDGMSPLGFGEVRRVKLNGASLPIEETATRVLDLDNAATPAWAHDFPDNWAPRAAVGEPRLNVPLLVAFICIFGILIGPVNLLWLAPRARRHRLFFTVPLLSAGASGLLLAIIALGDGIGGEGARNVLLFVGAGENRLHLWQEQMVRTRLLFQRSFQVPETVAVSYISPSAMDTPQPFRSTSNGASVALVREGATLSGDWFRTRATQGLLLRTAIPSRGEVVLRPGPVPELLSTLQSTLRHVQFVDAAGQYWTAPELSTGRPARLQPGSLADFERWSAKAIAPYSANLRAQFLSATYRAGYFYAEADPHEENTLPTLRSVSWKEQHVLCLGPCTETSAR